MHSSDGWIQPKCEIQHLSLFLDLNILLAATQSTENYFILALCNYTQYNTAAYIYIYIKHMYIYMLYKNSMQMHSFTSDCLAFESPS